MSTPVSASGSGTTAASIADALNNQTSGSTSSSSSSSTASTTSSSGDLSGTDTFLKLLVAQLQNQDPSSPMDDSTFITELAQFNSVEQMININTSVQQETASTQADEAISLMGKSVTYTSTPSGGGSSTSALGTVTGVQITSSGVDVVIGGQNVELSKVTAVGTASSSGDSSSSSSGSSSTGG
jgi:flagellar basal-body rod modification protein FlgD